METRILTLFDDEEFFPKELPKEKPKKEKATKPVSEEVTPVKNEDDAPSIFQEEDIPAIPVEAERLVDDKVPESEAIITYNKTEEEHLPNVTGQLDAQERLVDEREPENEVLPGYYDLAAAGDAGAIVKGGNDEPEIVEDSGSVVDKELNHQILSELIQLDYTALMQKDYAFDLNNATVINKELPKKEIPPVVENNDEGNIVEEEEVFEEIVPLPEWKLDKKYYTIGEVAQLFSVNTSHIRFWTTEFKLKPRTTRKGDRLYSPKDIAELRLIHHLVKEKKHTIKGAREKLKAEKSGVNNKLDLKESLLQLKETLLKIKEQL